MTIKRQLELEISEMSSVINHFEKNNDVVINRWVNQFGYTFEMIVVEFNSLISQYNKKYGKKFGTKKQK